MTKRVLDVGQCGPDHAAIRALVENNFDAVVSQTHLPADTLQTLSDEAVDLVLVNRKLDTDDSDGLEIIRQIKADPRLAGVPCMLVTNHAEHQQAAVAAGAETGFGKAKLADLETLERLERFLGPRR